MKNKKILKIVVVLIVATLSLSACENNKNVPSLYVNSLKQLYPNAKNVDWDFDDGCYSAEFHMNRTEITVYFDQNGNWFKKKTEYKNLNQLPQNIQNAFNNTEYKTWKVDDIELIEWSEKMNNENIYKIEVESGEREQTLIFATDGNRIR